jgi:hypothetical protein
MCLIETNVTSRPISFGHLAFEYLLAVFTKIEGLELGGVNLYVFYLFRYISRFL